MAGNTTYPVIILGMHRSGTTLVTQILNRCGLYIGRGEMAHLEAPFFQEVNNLLLSQVGGSWDNPEGVQYLVRNMDVRAVIKDYIVYLLRTRHAASFLGWRKYLQYRDVARVDFPWGWKDPRNTLTLPFWLDVFPEARIVHIFRHGVDVASSLSARYRRKFRVTFQRHNLWRYWLRPKRGRFTNSKVTQISLEFCFSLWEKYLSTARRYQEVYPDQFIEIQYEKLLQKPAQEIQRLLDFSGLASDDQLFSDLKKVIDPSRAFSFRSDPDLRAFEKTVAGRLAVFGY